MRQVMNLQGSIACELGLCVLYGLARKGLLRTGRDRVRKKCARGSDLATGVRGCS